MAVSHKTMRCQERATDLVRREEQDVRTRRVHLVTLTRVDGLLLYGFDLKRLQLLVEDLALSTRTGQQAHVTEETSD
jgi:hypothetical protein